MTDTTLLKLKIEDMGLKQSYIQKKLGISRSSWWMKRNGTADLTAEEIAILCDILRITSLREKEQIFFAKM